MGQVETTGRRRGSRHDDHREPPVVADARANGAAVKSRRQVGVVPSADSGGRAFRKDGVGGKEFLGSKRGKEKRTVMCRSAFCLECPSKGREVAKIAYLWRVEAVDVALASVASCRTSTWPLE